MAFEAKIAAGPGVLVVCRNNRRDLATVAATLPGRATVASSASASPEGLPPTFVPETGSLHLTSSRIASHTLDRRGLVEQPPRGDRGSKLRADPRRRRPCRRTDNETRSAPGDWGRRSRHGIPCGGAARGRAWAGLCGDARHRRSGRPGDPTSTVLGMGRDGGADIWALVRNLVAHPSQLSLLARVAADAITARAELLRVRRLLGPHFGLADFA